MAQRFAAERESCDNAPGLRAGANVGFMSFHSGIFDFQWWRGCQSTQRENGALAVSAV